MTDYVYLFRSTEAASQGAMGTPERAQQSLQKWIAWINGLEAQGHLKNRGLPLERSGSVVRGTERAVTDGPYMESKDLVLGFVVVQTEDLAQAVALAGGCPIVEGGGSVEVRPVMPMAM
jgi:hypothetical protein